MTFVETRIEIDKEKNLDTLGVWNLVKVWSSVLGTIPLFWEV